MKMPKNLSGVQLIKALENFGYKSTHQNGSHVHPTNQLPKEHHRTIPIHDSFRIGTLPAVLADVATRRGIMRNELLVMLFRK
jgi:predicted RNA binding protein YcfA (HicA-like mRNA interferase family)